MLLMDTLVTRIARLKDVRHLSVHKILSLREERQTFSVQHAWEERLIFFTHIQSLSLQRTHLQFGLIL